MLNTDTVYETEHIGVLGEDVSKPQFILVSYHFPPSTTIGALRPFRFYKYLRRRGYRCWVVTATPGASAANEDVIEVPDVPARWRERPVKWQLEGEIERVVRRFFFPGHVGVTWSVNASLTCERLLGSSEAPSVLLSTYPPLGALVTGLLTKYRTGVPWIADFRDPITIPRVEGRSWLARYCLRSVEESTFRYADAIISNVDTAAEAWRRMYPDAATKMSVIWNGYDPDDDISARPLPNRKERVILHAGNLYGGRNANVILNVLRAARETGARELSDVQVHLLGGTGSQSGIDEDLSQRAIGEGWLKVLPAVSSAEALHACQTSDNLLLLQPHTSVQVPAKLFQYVCIGRPILALAPRESAVEQILSQSGIRYMCMYPDAPLQENVAKLLAFLRLPTDPLRPSRFFLENFDVRSHANKLICIAEAAVNTSKQRVGAGRV